MYRKKIGPLPPVITAKWSPAVLDEGFVPFPKRLLRCLSRIFEGPAGMDQVRVVLAIVDYRRPNLTRPPSYEFLASTAGMTVEDFKARVVELEQRSLVEASGPDEVVTIEIDGLIRKILEFTSDESN